MAIFVVLAENANPDLVKRIGEKFPNDHFEIASNQWAVAADKISKEVSDDLDVSGGKFGRVIVFKTDGNFGYHKKTLWEWLKLKEAK